MTGWTNVVTQPLGLAGFALFLVFGYLARAKSKDERRWLSPVAMIVAVMALAGGLVLAYLQTPKPAAPVVKTAAPATQQNTQVQQTTSGPGSPAVQGVQGDVTITVDQSGANPEHAKPVVKKADGKSK
jgi:hypothetical protein